MRALVITRTMCCAAGRQILSVFVSGLGELEKPGKAGFSLRGYTTEEKKPHCWPKLTSFFFSRIAPVYQLGEKGGGREGISWCSEEGSWKQDPESSCLSALLTAARPPHPTSPGSYLRLLPA